MRFIRHLLNKGYAPRWLILQIDLCICIAAVILGYLLRNFSFEGFQGLSFALAIFFAVRLVGFYFSKTHHGIIRYTSTQDAKRIFYALASGTIFISLLNTFLILTNQEFTIPFLVIVFEFFATAFLMASFRVFVKIVYSELKSHNVEKKNVVIFGAGESGLITKRTVDQDKDSRRRVIGFFDDAQDKKGKTLEGVIIYNLEDNFNHLVSKYKIDELIIAVQEIGRKRKEEIVDLCLKHKIQVKTVPPASDWINGGFNINQIQNIRIEDL
nr:hypothetical protein [Bacteroidota bacterium]